VFKPEVTGKTTIEIFTMEGSKTAQVYNSEVVAGNEYKVNVPLTNYATGIYMYRITNGSKTEVGRLVVGR
jgi:hypothetical protein